MNKKKSKVRADELLVTLGLAQSQAQAAALIMAGLVQIKTDRGIQSIDKAGTPLSSEAELLLKSDEMNKDVSRGALKLRGAFEKWSLNVKHLKCIDIGASTGGFTQVLLENGA